MTTKLSTIEAEMHEVMDENDLLRSKLGLERREELKKSSKDKSLRIEKEADRALNVILRKEIDKLEDERLQLKMQLRQLSTRIGNRAVQMGLGAEDLLAIEQFTDELKKRRKETMKNWEHQLERAREGLLIGEVHGKLEGFGAIHQWGGDQQRLVDALKQALKDKGVKDADIEAISGQLGHTPVNFNGQQLDQQLMGKAEELRSLLQIAQEKLTDSQFELKTTKEKVV